MKRGVVVGELWASRQVPAIAGRSLKLVAECIESGDPADPELPPSEAQLRERGKASLIVAIDTLDARRGQQVLVAFGSGARNVLAASLASSATSNRELLADAAIALLIDGSSDASSDESSDDDPVEPAARDRGRSGKS